MHAAAPHKLKDDAFEEEFISRLKMLWVTMKNCFG